MVSKALMSPYGVVALLAVGEARAWRPWGPALRALRPRALGKFLHAHSRSTSPRRPPSPPPPSPPPPSPPPTPPTRLLTTRPTPPPPTSPKHQHALHASLDCAGCKSVIATTFLVTRTLKLLQSSQTDRQPAQSRLDERGWPVGASFSACRTPPRLPVAPPLEDLRAPLQLANKFAFVQRVHSQKNV
ncbi:Protein of unknown function [Gryllus bimaculatus]|nr:Protein of unknown function [Gryllus bimaculatus]